MNLDFKKQQIQNEKAAMMEKIKEKDDEEEFDYIDMTDVQIINPSQKKKPVITELEAITEQQEPLTN